MINLWYCMFRSTFTPWGIKQTTSPPSVRSVYCTLKADAVGLLKGPGTKWIFYITPLILNASRHGQWSTQDQEIEVKYTFSIWFTITTVRNMYMCLFKTHQIQFVYNLHFCWQFLKVTKIFVGFISNSRPPLVENVSDTCISSERISCQIFATVVLLCLW